MTLDDFMDEQEIMKLTGWSKGTLQNHRCSDHTFPKPCRGKVRRYLKKEIMAWYTNRNPSKKAS